MQTEAEKIVSIPHSAVEPILTKYVDFYFGRRFNETTRAFRNKETPLIEAARREDETSVFILLYLNWWIQDNVGKPSRSASNKSTQRNKSLMDSSDDDFNGNILGNTESDNRIYCDINAQDQQGWTSLHWAAVLGNYRICRLLLDHNANVNIHTTSFPFSSCEYTSRKEDGDTSEEVSSDSGNPVGNESCFKGTAPFHFAIQQGHVSITKLMLPRASFDTLQSSLQEASSVGNFELVQLLADQLLYHHGHVEDEYDRSQKYEHCLQRLQLSLGWSAVTIACKGTTCGINRSLGEQRLSDIYDNGNPIKLMSVSESLILYLLHHGANFQLPRVSVGYPTYRDGPDGASSYSGQEGMTLLHVSIVHGMKSVVSWLLQRSDIDVDVRNDRGWSPLHFAIDCVRRHATAADTGKIQLQSRLEILQMLVIDCGADVNATTKAGWAPLHFASEWLLLDGVSSSEARFSKQLDSTLCQEQFFLPIVQLLLDHGAYQQPINSGNVSGSGQLKSEQMPPTPLYLAVKCRKHIIQRKFDCRNKKEVIPPSLIVKVLLQRLGRISNVNAPNKHGLTALHAAAINGDAATVRLLLQEAGSDVNATDNQDSTPLWYAIQSSSFDTVEVILDYGGSQDIQRQNRLGSTPFLCALAYGSKKLAELLLRYDPRKRQVAY